VAEPVSIHLTVNGAEHALMVHPLECLLDVLRERLGLTGTKEGCGEGECGACAVLLNGRLVTSCLVPALEADGASITTIEGLAEGDFERALKAGGGIQCGFCTPGIIVAGGDLSGQLCRCTGYARIRAAAATPTEPA
jgi:aerobic-type carbon monoxide dehydrogenase small subunit (CoxS/CutS family)